MTRGPIELFKDGVQTFAGEASPAPGGGSGPFDPLAVTGLGLWLAPASLAGMSEGDPLALWPDSSGNGRDMAAVGAAIPVISAGPPIGVLGTDAVMALATGFDLFSSLAGCTIGVRARKLDVLAENVIYAQDGLGDTFAGVDLVSTATTGDLANSAALCFGDPTSGPFVNAAWFSRDRSTAVVSIEPQGVTLLAEPVPDTPAYVGHSPGVGNVTWALSAYGPVVRPPFFATQGAGAEDETSTTTDPAATIALFSQDAINPGFGGVLCELLVYQRVLTAAERRGLFEYLSAEDLAA